MHVQNNILVPCAPYLNQWFQDAALNEDALKKRVLAGELKAMPQQDRLFLLAFIERQEWLHKAVENNEEAFIKALIEAGANLNALDVDGNSVLVHAKAPKMLCWLRDNGAQFIQADKISLLQFVLSKCHHTWNEKERTEWKNLLVSIMLAVPLEDFCTLEGEPLTDLMRMAKDDEKIREILLGITVRINNEKPYEILPIAKKLLSHDTQKKYLEALIELIKMNIIKDPFIEQIVTQLEILFWNTKNTEFFDALGQCWQPRSDLLTLTHLCGDLRLGVYIKSLLNTTSLNEAAKLFAHIEHFPDMDDLHGVLKNRLKEHVLLLQTKANSTIWIAIAKQVHGIKDLVQLKKLGFDPQWTDPINGRTYLFTESAWHLKYEKEKNAIGFDIHRIDAHGDNALEYHCRNPAKKNSCSSYEALAKLGIMLSDKFPNVQKCRSTFPDNPYFQAILGACLLHPRKNVINEILRHFPSSEESALFSQTVRNDPELKEIFGKHFSSRQEVDYKNWHKGFMPADAERLDKFVGDRYSKEWDLAFLAKFWEGTVPSDVFDAIPESPVASLVVGAIRKQHQQLIDGKIKKPVTPRKLFGNILNHDDMVYINRYLFAHPDLMRILVQDYMNAQHISIQSGGGSITTYGNIISMLMSRMGKLLQLSKHEWDLPEWHRKLLNAFNEHVPPIPAETLKIPDSANVRLLGRTAIVTSSEGCDAYKFLKEGEQYDHFSQEHSVTKALYELGDHFKSQIIKPIGVYAVKHLPPALARYQHHLTGNQPAYVFHYKALPETFVYLQDVPAEKYAESRFKTLHDAAKLIRLGIYPDLAAMFHNHKTSRRYILLVDVMTRLIGHLGIFSMFSPAGGGGRMENPFVKTKYPNARQTGMTDWRDASKYYGWGDSLYHKTKDMNGLHDTDKDGVSYFYQMSALSNILLVDMLILAERYINEGNLQWKNDILMQKFGRELAEGFAQLSASYSSQPYDQALKFILENGIDWTRAARQIAFWLDTGPEGYPAWAAQGKLPPGLYEESIHIEVDVSKAKNFEGPMGFRTDGNLDIGAFNGPLAFDQFEKAAHLLFNTVALAEPMTPPPEPERPCYGYGYYGNMWL